MSNPNYFEQFKSACYQDGGRSEGIYDCWGLVRKVLTEHYQVPDLPSYGYILATDKKAMTQAGTQLKPQFKRLEVPCDGAIAAGYRGSILLHVGVCVLIDHQIKVLHAQQSSGISFVSLEQFARCAGNRVEYYAYAN